MNVEISGDRALAGNVPSICASGCHLVALERVVSEILRSGLGPGLRAPKVRLVASRRLNEKKLKSTLALTETSPCKADMDFRLVVLL